MIVLRDSEDEAALRSALHQLFAKYQGNVPNPAGTSADRAALWAQLIEMGVLAMAAPDSSGDHATLTQLCVVAEEAGANLLSAGLVEHLTVARFLGTADFEVAHDIVSQSVSATIALRPSQAGCWPTVPISATPSLVVGVHHDALGVLRLSATPAGARALGPLQVCDVPVDENRFVRLGPAAQLQILLDHWRVLSAAYLIGASDVVLARTVAYVGDRHQFGRPVGAYQAVQHGLADLPGMLSGARLLVGKAAWSVDCPELQPANDLARNDITDPEVLASMALLFASDMANSVADRAIHYHGAIGAAAETGIHHFYRLVRSLPLLLGPISSQRRRLADLLVGPAWNFH